MTRSDAELGGYREGLGGVSAPPCLTLFLTESAPEPLFPLPGVSSRLRRPAPPLTPPLPQATMIEVVCNDRLGKKVRVKCKYPGEPGEGARGGGAVRRGRGARGSPLPPFVP